MFDNVKPRPTQHPDDPYFDEVRIALKERYKTSGLSGDEWRFSARVELFRKGTLVAYRNGGSMDLASIEAVRALKIGPGELEMDGQWEVLDFAEHPHEGICCQPGCPNPATRTYVMKRLFDRSCVLSEENTPDSTGHIDAREFCDDHGDRGDCGLDDSNSNYICVKGKDWYDAPVDPEKISKSVLGAVIVIE